MAIDFEWDVEIVATANNEDFAKGDIVDHMFSRSYADAKEQAEQEEDEGYGRVIVLVRDDDRRSTRAWAYMKDGKLPAHFEDAYGREIAKVPKRFHDEVANAG